MLRPQELLSKPTFVVFIASLLLSLTSMVGSELNRDGMLYIRVAEAAFAGNIKDAFTLFSWPFLSLLIAATARLTQLSLEHSAYLLNSIFLAGTCSLVIACSQKFHKESVWWVVLTLLTIPGINEYRNELLREYGYWFFVLLTFWLALKWDQHPSWKSGLIVQLTLACAALFRPEALVLFFALAGWQTTTSPADQRLKRVAMLAGIAALSGALLIILFLNGMLGARLTNEFGRLSSSRFDAKAQFIAQTLIDYARPNAGIILFFGSLALIPIKIIQKFGPFIIPFIYALFTHNKNTNKILTNIFSWGGLATLLFLGVFVTDLQFLSGRYVGLTLIFATPITGYGLWRLTSIYKTIKLPILILSSLLALPNVISLNNTKHHYKEAGEWLGTHIEQSNTIYINSSRTAFYAGWRDIAIQNRHDHRPLEISLAKNEHSTYVIETKNKESNFDTIINTHSLQVVKEFKSSNGDKVTIAKPIISESRQ